MAYKEHRNENLINDYQASSERVPKTTDIYRLKIEKSHEIAEGVIEKTVHAPKTINQTKQKVIMAVGQSGTGKSTFINRMINYLFGVQFGDKFRFQLVVEQASSQTCSQTKHITVYRIPAIFDKYPYNLTIIDTPGFGHTEKHDPSLDHNKLLQLQAAADAKHVEKIRLLFQSGAINILHAICFVTCYGQKLLDTHQSYIFQSIAKIFGKDAENNIFVIATHCHTQFNTKKNSIAEAPVLECLKLEKIPYRDWYPFNNKELFQDIDELDDTDFASDKKFWETGDMFFEILFGDIDSTLPVSINITREILQKFHMISEVTLPHLMRKIESLIIAFKDHEINSQQIKANDKTRTVNVLKPFIEEINKSGIFCIRCDLCNTVCHYPCTTSERWSLRWCSAMSWFNLQLKIYCTLCKCSWRDHKRYTNTIVYRTVKEIRTESDLINKYLHNSSEKSELITECEKEMVSSFKDILETYNDIENCITFINDSNISHIVLTIESIITQEKNLKSGQKDDWKELHYTIIERLTKISKQDIDKQFHSASFDQKKEFARSFLQT